MHTEAAAILCSGRCNRSARLPVCPSVRPWERLMALVLLKRIVWTVPILLGISLVVFSMMHLAPGDPAEAILGPRGTKELLAQARHELGLDRPIYAQYGAWLVHA